MREIRASATDKARLIETFIALCEIPSPSGSEGAVGSFVKEQLEQLGLSVKEDGAATVCDAGCGNLQTEIEGGTGQSILMCAHMDTVPVDGPIEVVQRDGYIENGREAILGADNKAAVALLIELARKYVNVQPAVGIEFLFTVREENGLAGAKAFDTDSLSSKFGYVFDHGSPIGELMVSAPTHQKISADFTGVGAHAGVEPERGRSAIRAAAKAIESMSLGRIDDTSTANVGAIKGGTAVNVVPESCRMLAEVRSLDHERSLAMAQEMVDACNLAAGACETDVEIVVEEEFRAYSLSTDSKSVRAGTASLEALGFTVECKASGGGSDANAFIAKGFECLNIANGTEANHTANERVSVSALETMLDVGHSVVAISADV